MELKELEEEIKKIKERNKKVELDKAWETSWVIGFTLSTLSLGLVRKVWEKNNK